MALAAVLAIGAAIFGAKSLLTPSEPAPKEVTQAPQAAPVEKPSPLDKPVQTPKPAPSETKAETKAEPRKTVAPASTEVELASSPQGAKVTVAETGESCTTPCKLELPSSRYVFNYTLAGHRPATSIIVVPKETRSFARMESTNGTLMVSSTPAGAEIFLDGKEQSQKSPAILKVASGKYRLEVKLAGFKDYGKDIEIKDGETTEVGVAWSARTQ